MENAAGVASTVRDGWLVWEFPGKPVSVRVSPDAAGRLAMAVREGFKALPRRGLETGGLLIGSRREAGNKTVVEIDDFEPVESEHAAGPAYLLSESDLRILKSRIAAREVGRNTSVVGFYRSHTRPDFAISGDDASLFSTYFRGESDVFLLIKPNGGGPPMAGFIIREVGKVVSDSPYAQFLLEGTIGIQAHETPIRALEETQSPPRAVQIVPPTAPMRTPWMVRRRMWLASTGVAVLAVCLFMGIQRRVPVSIPVKPGRSLALSVTNTGNSLRLSWDRQSTRRAAEAILWIKDGQETQRFELDSKQLSEGSVVYWPTHSDVDFRFEMLSAGASVTESVRAIGGPSKTVAADSAPVTAAVVASAIFVPSRKPPRQRRIASHGSATMPPLRDGVVPASRRLSSALGVRRPDHDPATSTPAALPDPPTIQPVVARPSTEEEFLKPMVPANDLVGPNSPFRVIVEPVPASRRGIPLIGKRYRREDYVPPTPLRNPGPPDPPHRNIARDVNIDVKVYVNASGKVDYSEAFSKVAESDRDLAAVAVFSARRWEFVPARTGDGTVPGEVILHYQFGPKADATGNRSLATR